MANCPPDSGEYSPLGVFSDNGRIYLFHRLHDAQGGLFHIDVSSDGLNFGLFQNAPKLLDKKRLKIDIDKCCDFHVARTGESYFLTFKYRVKNQDFLYGATSSDLTRWQSLGQIMPDGETGVIVSQYQFQGNYVMYYGERSINIALSTDLKSWKKQGTHVINQQEDFFGTWPVTVGNAWVTDEGILVLYYIEKTENGKARHQLNAALFDKNNPQVLLNAFSEPIWEANQEVADKHAMPLGVARLAESIISYWRSEKEGLFALVHPFSAKKPSASRGFPSLILNKIKENPIIRPIVEHLWESKATFNPAAVYEEGKIHIIYRAIGESDVSVLGYATSRDGVHIDERLDEPIYIPIEPFESSSPLASPVSPSPFTSGGGCFGGCEDPRLTKIDGRYYMTYVAYDGWGPPRVAITSISVEDFKNRRWSWDRPVLISPPGVVDKNACILPEKINGKYVIFHRVFPNILVDYVDSLAFDGRTFLKGEHKIAPRPNFWDSRKIGVGSPPIKTPEGWLMIYHAVGHDDASRYKVGAMLLDRTNPTKVIMRTSRPILEPTEWYENEGYKAGVAYPCGAVAVKNQLFVYYGGADTVVCVATAPLSGFLDQLKSSGNAQLTPLGIQSVTRYHG